MATETLFDEMKRYVRWSEEDERALAILGRAASGRFRLIAEEFYARIREHEEADAVLQDEQQIERLKRTLVQWMERLCHGPHDESYFEERARIGRVHVRVGLPQRYMFMAMALVRTALHQIAAELPESVAIQLALARILDLELAIMLETYRDDYVARIQRAERAERTVLERALARSERRYVNAVELAGVLVIGLDAKLRTTLFNREAERVTGFSRDEVVGAPFLETLVPEELRAETRRRIEAAIDPRGEEHRRWDVELVSRAGKRRTVALQLASARQGEDDDVAVFAVGPDVTEEREFQQRMVRSEKLAAVGTLAAGLAHEIRNPLNGALLHVTFLERALAKHGYGPEVVDAVRLVGEEIRRLSSLVKDFLVFARPAAPTLAPVSLRAIVERVVELVGADADAAQARVVSETSGLDLVVEVDGARMEQAILNLVRNAIDAVASQGGGRVVVRVLREGRRALIEVEDDGPGLPGPEAPIFDAFYSTKPHGTGLGLAIVHRVVTDHGGTIDVESRPGRTVFRIALSVSTEVA